MRVKATSIGYYGHKRRRPGEEFVLRAYKKAKIVTEPNHPKRGQPEIDPKTGKPILELIPVEKQFSARWMEMVDEEAPAKPKGKGGKAAPEPDLEPEEDVI